MNVDGELAAHLFYAMRAWPPVARSKAWPLPAGWFELEAVVLASARAMNRQQPTALDVVEVGADAAPVTPVFLKLVEVAGVLNISQRSAERLVETGALASCRVGGSRRVHIDDLTSYAQSLRPQSKEVA